MTQLVDSRFSASLAEATLEATDDGILVIDRERKVIKYNSRFSELWRIPRDVVASNDDEQLLGFVRDQLAEPRQFLAKVVELYNSPEAESFDSIEFRDGRIFERYSRPMYLDGQVVARVWSFRDVTARKKSDRLLRSSEERFSLALRGANDGMWDWDLETNEVYYSPRWKSMLGYQEHELANNLDTWARLVHPEDKQSALARVQDYIEGRAHAFEAELRMRHKSGQMVVVLSRAFLVNREDDGKAIRLVGTHVDITARKKAESHLKKNAEILEMIATGISAPKIYDQIALMYEARHPGMRCSMLELKDGKLMHGGAPSLPKEYCQAVHGLTVGPSVGSCGTSTYTGRQVLVEDIATDPKWADIKAVALPHGMRCCWSEPIKDSQGLVLGAFGMYYDHPALPDEEEAEDLKAAARLAGIVMERDQAQHRIRYLAFTDELTGLSSRASFHQDLEQMLGEAARHSQRFALLYIDLDDFKSVNDSLGHDVGDRLLQEVAQRLQGVSRQVDCVSRLGGDEFCILVRNIEDAYDAAHVAKRCLEAIARPIELSSRQVVPTCSIGIAHHPEDGTSSSVLMKAADTALYAAKEHGKNQYAFYQPILTQKAEHRFLVEQHLREAIEHRQLNLVYQPLIDIASGEITGFEALARWHHPRLGSVNPAEFIATAERIGIIKPLTEWVLETSCAQAVAWEKSGHHGLKISVNISPNHLDDQAIVPLVERVLGQSGLEPVRLQLEVTENAIHTNQRNMPVFQRLKELGVVLAIDDFGTGYSSFASLKHLAVDWLKIDQYFVGDMVTDEEAHRLVQSMIELGHNLGYGVIAEGVESADQLAALRALGCEIAQGYLFGEPVAADAIDELLQIRGR